MQQQPQWIGVIAFAQSPMGVLFKRDFLPRTHFDKVEDREQLFKLTPALTWTQRVNNVLEVLVLSPQLLHEVETLAYDHLYRRLGEGAKTAGQSRMKRPLLITSTGFDYVTREHWGVLQLKA